VTYVGIDQSFGGFAVVALRSDNQHQVYVRAFSASQYGTGVDRLLAVERWLEQVLRLVGPKSISHVVMEGYSRQSQWRREEAGAMSYAVRRVLWYTLPYPAKYPTIVAPRQRAVYATGDGRADKKQVMEAVRDKWGVVVSNHNAADAYVLARMAKDLVERTSEHDYERKVIARLNPYTELPRAA